MNTSEEITKIKDIVEDLLKIDLRCRNDDKWLVYQVTRKFTKIFIPFEDFKKIPAFETITRCRRFIQNTEGKYLANKETDNKRIDRENDFRNINKLNM